jgi:macrolide-specific efflux system membrane fusion protein
MPTFTLATMLLAVPPLAMTPSPPRPASPAAAREIAAREILVPHCLVSLIDDVQVPALEAGALASVAVVEGQYVAEGQLLAQLDDRQPRLDKLAAELQRDAALTKAQDDIEVRYADAAFAVAAAELDRALSIDRKNAGSVTQQEIAKLQLAKRRDELQIERSKLEMRVAKMNADVHQAGVKSADDAVARRQILSPLPGVVVNLSHEKGEWVAAGDPVVQVVRINRLRVEGFLSADEVAPEEVAGRAVSIEVSFAGGRTARFPGQIVFISPLVQAGNKYRVRAEVENQTENGNPLLRPGMTANMSVVAGVPPAATRTVR